VLDLVFYHISTWYWFGRLTSLMRESVRKILPSYGWMVKKSLPDDGNTLVIRNVMPFCCNR